MSEDKKKKPAAKKATPKKVDTSAKIEKSANEPKDTKGLTIVTDSREGISMEVVKKFNENKHPLIVFTVDEAKYAQAGVDGIAFTPTDDDVKKNGFKYPELIMYIKVTDFVNELDQSMALIQAVEQTYGTFQNFINTSTVISNELVNNAGGPSSPVEQLAALRTSMGSLQLMSRVLGTDNKPDMDKYRHHFIANVAVSKRSEPTDADPRNLTINALKPSEHYTADMVSMQQILPEDQWPKQFSSKEKGYNAVQAAEMIYLLSQLPESDTAHLIKTIYNF
jgi:hypothetical protein